VRDPGGVGGHGGIRIADRASRIAKSRHSRGRLSHVEQHRDSRGRLSYAIGLQRA